MSLNQGVADLHMHTTASDGTCSVSDRLEQAVQNGLQAIAITDHDTLSADLSGRVANEAVELISGVEVRADVNGTKVELLGYYVDPDDRQLGETLERVREYRHERNQRIFDQLRELTPFDRSYASARTETDDVLGRPHIAGMLVEDGIADSIGDAFDRYLGDNGEAYVPMERVDAAEIIATLQDAGGVVSFAHPGRVRTTEIEDIVRELVADGIDAIEVPYPYSEAPTGGYADVGVEDAASLADRFDLLWTGGSDCHGPESGKFRFGEVRVTESRLDALRERAGERRPLQDSGR